ncbi:dodecin family protein [Mesorhizobium tianshanense]|uniref:dodecin family protein n=1 Tax=Mesorhizobium tianshanense TaxID=39844 RepID=UPI0011A2E2D0
MSWLHLLRSWSLRSTRRGSTAAKTVRNIKSIYIENFEATVDQDQIKSYRINARISFLLD